jgi:hypothetical protein
LEFVGLNHAFLTENEQMVYWCEGANAAEQQRAAENSQKTHLTEWFTANETLPDAINYTYQEFLQYFAWVSHQKKWKPRQQGFAIGRICFLHPAAGETFYLRLLLTIKKGAKCWNDLKIVDGAQHPIFQAACVRSQLLSREQLRCYFAQLLL